MHAPNVPGRALAVWTKGHLSGAHIFRHATKFHLHHVRSHACELSGHLRFDAPLLDLCVSGMSQAQQSHDASEVCTPSPPRALLRGMMRTRFPIVYVKNARGTASCAPHTYEHLTFMSKASRVMQRVTLPWPFLHLHCTVQIVSIPPADTPHW